MFELRTGGTVYTGWVTVEVTRAIDTFAHEFHLTHAGLHQVERGALIDISYLDQHLTSGWADSITSSVSAQQLTSSVDGRGRTADLVDCAVIHKSGQWINKGARDIIGDIVKPFGLKLAVDPLVPYTKIARFDIETGETAFDAIDRIARAVGFVPMSGDDGGLKLTRFTRTAGLHTETLPRYCISRGTQISDVERFSSYRVLSQSGRSDPEESPRRAALERVDVKDTGVKRYRPTVIHNETGARVAEMKAHAEWSRNTAVGRSLRFNASIPGILAPSGKAWSPGTLVYVDDRELGVNDALLCVSVTSRLGPGELVTEITCVPPEAYTTEPISDKELTSKLRKI